MSPIPSRTLAVLPGIDRERRNVERRIRLARFPQTKSFDTFDFAAQPSLNKALVLELMHCEWIEKRQNCIALGPSGTGKTHTALGLGGATAVMERTSLVRALKPLQASGWVVAERSGNGRAFDVTLSVSGLERVVEAMPLWAEAQTAFEGEVGRDRAIRLRDEILELNLGG